MATGLLLGFEAPAGSPEPAPVLELALALACGGGLRPCRAFFDLGPTASLEPRDLPLVVARAVGGTRTVGDAFFPTA